MKLLEKSRAYYMTDKNTPILGELVTRARELLEGDFVFNPLTAPMAPWLAQFDVTSQYMNEPADWMHDYAEQVLPDLRIREFRVWLNQTETLEDLLTPPTLREKTQAKPTVPVVVDEEVLSPTPKIKLPAQRTAQQLDFETWKAKKIKDGTWKEKVTTDKKIVQENRSTKRNTKSREGQTKSWSEGK